MQARLKITTVLVTMVAMFAMLPALSAVAAEPLDDGTYDVTIDDTTYRLTVDAGQPMVAPGTGVEWLFAYNDDGVVLDEFTVVVDGAAYEVEIGEDGTAFATPHDDDFVPTPPAPDVSLAVEEPELDADEGEEVEEEELQEDEDAEDAAHGELVSAVAQCAPNGREAREAGMPNHGAIVSAVAKGDVLEFTVDGVDDEFVVDGKLGADAVCAELEAALEAAVKDDADEAPRGNGKAPVSEDAETAGDAPGKSGEARGKAKKGQQD